MKKILAFAGSNSSTSINLKLIKATAQLIDFVQVDVIDLREYNVPIFGVDLEAEQGTPAKMRELSLLIGNYDGFLIATPEHNNMPPAFFLNIIDWLSRIDRSIFGEKPVFVMSTSPGARAGVSALAILESTLPRFGGKVVAVYSLPSFNANFGEGEIVNDFELEKLKQQISVFRLKISELNTSMI
jgi:chromate reductase, NAD(P)H dehydrogenase (quinone)